MCFLTDIPCKMGVLRKMHSVLGTMQAQLLFSLWGNMSIASGPICLPARLGCPSDAIQGWRSDLHDTWRTFFEHNARFCRFENRSAAQYCVPALESSNPSLHRTDLGWRPVRPVQALGEAQSAGELSLLGSLIPYRSSAA